MSTTTEFYKEPTTTLEIFETSEHNSKLIRTTMVFENLNTDENYFNTTEKINEIFSTESLTPESENKSLSETEDISDPCDDSVSYETIGRALLCRASLETAEVNFSKNIIAEKSDLIIPTPESSAITEELKDVTTHSLQSVLSEDTMSKMITENVHETGLNYTTLTLIFGMITNSKFICI